MREVCCGIHLRRQTALGGLEAGYCARALKEATALFKCLSQNHPFLGGNKYTAITAIVVFSLMNANRLHFDDLEAENWLIGLYETGRVSKSTIESWLCQQAEPI